MKTEKKKRTVITCIAVSSCVLAGSVFASFSTANGYDNLKSSLKMLIGQENYTLEAKAAVLIDNNKINEYTYTEKLNKGDEIPYRSTTNNYNVNNSYKNDTVYQNGKIYDLYTDLPHGKDMWVSHNLDTMYNNSDYTLGSLDINEDDRKTIDKIIRFCELLTDVVVGDLKNNFVYTGETDDGGAKYTISLDAVQIPELINAGFSALCSLETPYPHNGEYDKNDPMYYLYDDTAIKSGMCEFTTDSTGRLSDINAKIEFSSTGIDKKSHTAAFTFGLTLSDYGTTVVEGLDEETTANALVRPDYTNMTQEEYEKASEEFTKELYGENNIKEETTVVTSFPENGESSSSAIIGGADAPTAVYITE